MTTLVGGHFYNIMHEWQQAQSWGPPDGSNRFTGGTGLDRVRDLAGQRIGILGYGSIGRQVGRVAKAMGMQVLAYTASPRSTPESRRDTGYIVPETGDPEGTIPVEWFSGTAKEDLHTFLSADIDVLVVSMPLTPQTTHLLGGAEINLLARRNAFIVNISRGQIVVQDALITALRAFADEENPLNHGKRNISGIGRAGLRGAALDVADPEPLPQGHPLFTTPNCIVTPHISGMSVEYSARAFDVLRLNMEKFRDGEKLINEVDRKKGY
jgi:phosphoglycerate dehydrogenase-like enzyme